MRNEPDIFVAIEMATKRVSRWFVARRTIGGTYQTIAECSSEHNAKQIARSLNEKTPFLDAAE